MHDYLCDTGGCDITERLSLNTKESIRRDMNISYTAKIKSQQLTAFTDEETEEE